MNTPIDPTDPRDPLDALKQRIRRSSASLRDRHGQQARDSLLFLNTQYESFPVAVQTEHGLSPAARVVFNNLWLWAKRQNAGSVAGLFPDYDWIMRACSMSRGSVASAITQLRLMRFVTLHQKIRNEQGVFVGNDFILNDEPMALGDTLLLDGSYAEFVIDALKHRHKRVRSLAELAWTALEHHINTADDPFRPQSQIERMEARQQASAFVQQRLHPELAGDQPEPPDEYYGIPIDAYRRMIERTLDDAADDDQSQVHKVNLEVNAAENHQVHKVNSVSKPNQVHKVNAAETAPDQQIEKLSTVNLEVNAGMNLGVNSCSSSNIYKTTTTDTEPEFTKDESDDLSDLEFPEFRYPNERTLCEPIIRSLPPEHRQAMLDELAGRMSNTRDPLRNTVAWLKRVVERFHAGNFTFTSHSLERAEARQKKAGGGMERPTDYRQQIQELHGEIEHLNRLIEFQRSGPAADDATEQLLTEQRTEKQRELEALLAKQKAAAG